MATTFTTADLAITRTYRAGRTLGVVYTLGGRRCSTLIGGQACDLHARVARQLGLAAPSSPAAIVFDAAIERGMIPAKRVAHARRIQAALEAGTVDLGSASEYWTRCLKRAAIGGRAEDITRGFDMVLRRAIRRVA